MMNYSAEKLLVKQLLKAIPKLASLAQRARQITYVHNTPFTIVNYAL